MLRRDWSDANAKRGPCRVCGRVYGVELAHLSGRVFDPPSERAGFDLYVRPESVVPLCGPATDSGTCHAKQERGAIDLIPHTSRAEQVSVVHDLGLEAAYRKLVGGR